MSSLTVHPVLRSKADADPGALLLERLGRSLDQLGLPIRARHEILCTAAELLWRPAPGAPPPAPARPPGRTWPSV